MGIFDWFTIQNDLLAVDIGSSGIKLLELDSSGKTSTIINIAETAIPQDSIVNNAIVKKGAVAQAIQSLLTANKIDNTKIAVAVPSQSVFTKRITMAKLPYNELKTSLEMETENFLPPGVGEVKVDFHIIREASPNSLELLAVAAKKDIVDSYLETFSQAGLEVKIVDVNSFALQNAFENAYPEYRSKTVALIDIGGRYTEVNVCRDGESLMSGDFAVGSRSILDTLVQRLEISFDDAEKVLRGERLVGLEIELVLEILHNKMLTLAGEINRQLSMLWNAAGIKENIDMIMLAGGCANLPNLKESITIKTSLPCEVLDPFKVFKFENNKNWDFVDNRLRSRFAVATGLALRQSDEKKL